jgi:hypothetical protein
VVLDRPIRVLACFARRRRRLRRASETALPKPAHWKSGVSVFASVAAAAVFFNGGCSHRAAAPPALPVSIPIGAPSGGFPVIGPSRPMPAIRLPVPGLAMDLNWLDLDGFFPPGARRVGPANPVSLDLCEERRTRFPTTELCASVDGRFVLFHDGMKRQRGIFHWLLLLEKDALYPNTIFGTNMAFDVSWSDDSKAFAVTHYIGHNTSEVFVVGSTELERRPINLRPALEAYFPERAISAPMFIKAYRWTRRGQLIVRGLARSEQEPYEQFGCEAAIDFVGNGAEPQVTFLRGYAVSQSTEP